MDFLFNIIVSLLIVVFVLALIASGAKFGKRRRRSRTYSSRRYSPEEKGSIGENKVSLILKGNVFKEHYLINDLILTDGVGNSSQIDHIFINENGVWVIETKTYSGKIYGEANQTKWVQSINYGHSNHKFYNPIKQNATHVYRIAQAIGNHYPIHSLVVFIDADISDVHEKNVINLNRLYGTVWNDYRNVRILSSYEMKQIYDCLNRLKNNQILTSEEHVKNIDKMQKNIDMGICPRCGAFLVVRKGKNGEFYGCKNYPKCKFTKEIDKS